MRVQFPHWPVWNYQFPQRDVKRIASVTYKNEAGADNTLAEDHYRLAIGRNGVSCLVLLRKGELPKAATRVDAVSVEYEA